MGEQFFKRAPQRSPHGLTEEQLIEAFNLYEKKIFKEIIEKLQKDYLLDLEYDSSLDDLLRDAINSAFLKGMELMESKWLVTDYYKEVKKIVTDDRCGVLDKSTGKFYPCAFTHHWQKVLGILELVYPDKYEQCFEFSRKENEESEQKRELEEFILNNFELKGGSWRLEDHVRRL